MKSPIVSTFITQAIFVLLTATTPPVAAAKNICVNSAGSLDAGCDVAVRSIAEVNALTPADLEAGDQVLFKRGEVWREQLTIPVSGSPGIPIRFGAYGDPSLNNPRIGWDVNLFNSQNAGFEVLISGTANDGVSDNFDKWTEANLDGGNYIDALSPGEFGTRAVNMHTTSSATLSTSTYLRRQINNINPSTTYHFSLYSKYTNESAQGLRVRIHHLGTGKNVMADGNWGAVGTAHYLELNAGPVTASGWQERNITFTTEAGDIGALRIDIIAREPNTTVAVDNVYLAEGSARAANNDDTGILETRCIHVNSRDHIEIDSIDATGPTLDASGASSYVVDIAGTSSDVTISNLSVSHASGIGIWSDHSTHDVDFIGLDVHDNGNTGVYLNSQVGSVTNSRVYQNGAIGGDAGGIGIQGQNILIADNEVFNNGRGGSDADFEISVAMSSSEVFYPRDIQIVRNYVHDCMQGCIQVAQIRDSGYESLVAYNVISGYRDNTAGSASSHGKWSGIRVGDSPNMRIYNNVITGGKSAADAAYGATHAALFVTNTNNPGLKVKNNIIYENETKSVYVRYSASLSDLAGFDIDNNIYEESASEAKFNWKNIDYMTLSQWRSAALSDGIQLDGQSKTSAPMFVTGELQDFHLAMGSPAIDAGVDVGILSDIDGNLIVGTPDIGAYEAQDRDFDGFAAAADCDDQDPTRHPGVMEVYNDGVDQDCAEGDALITINEASWTSKARGKLTVSATTPLGVDNPLSVDNFGAMDWVGGEWILTRKQTPYPGSITIRGLDGYINITVE